MLDIPNVEDAPEEMAVGRMNFLGSGYRAATFVPLMRGETAIGALSVVRVSIGPLSEKQLAALKTYASQAVIAIENTRLLNELRQRTDDLAESLEQQTATADVLRVISSSPGELEPVFQAMLENATRICEAELGVLYRFDGGAFHFAAEVGAPPVYAEFNRQRGPFQPTPGGQLERVMLTKGVSHTADDANSAIPGIAARLAGARTQIIVPMLKESELVGAIIIYRQEVRPFSDKQIELLKNFAAQAVIAIENTRLLSELRQSLEQQTATADVLGVISSSPGELEPVFQAMLENAVRICEAKFGQLYRFEGGAFHLAAGIDIPPDYAEFLKKRGPFLPPAGSQLDRAMKTKRASYTADMAADATPGSPARLGGARSAIAVPMLKDGELVGAIIIYRQEVRPFSDKQVELVQNFAAQAVIAIENTRLLNELRQSLEQQTATADVLRAISASPGELEPVFQAMLENAVRICDAKFGDLWLAEGDGFRFGGLYGTPAAYAEAWMREPLIHPGPSTGLVRAKHTKKVVHVPDVVAEAAYAEREPIRVALVELAGARTLVVVPMLKDNAFVGAIAIYRQEVRPFTDNQIALVQSFAAQAVIAIENTRLLNELRQSLEQQTATSEVLQVISSSPGDLAPVFQAMLENATRICEAKFGALLSFDGNMFQFAAEVGTPPEFGQFMRQRGPFSPAPGSHLERVLQTKQLSHTADYAVRLRRGSTRPLGRRPIHGRRANAQGWHLDGRRFHLPPGSPAVHRKADCAAAELCRPSRDRHREYAAAQ